MMINQDTELWTSPPLAGRRYQQTSNLWVTSGRPSLLLHLPAPTPPPPAPPPLPVLDKVGRQASLAEGWGGGEGSHVWLWSPPLSLISGDDLPSASSVFFFPFLRPILVGGGGWKLISHSGGPSVCVLLVKYYFPSHSVDFFLPIQHHSGTRE